MAAAGAEDGVPSKVNQRYDRQLRLWGDHGQAALSSASICCIGASAVATEILKNLVLPGIGAFTLVDDRDVTLRDTGSNFFVEEGRLGEPRAQVATELLLEMNEFVKGEWRRGHITEILRDDPSFLQKFTVVVVANQLASTVSAVAKSLYESNIPLVVAVAYGNIGSLQIVVKEHCVVEYHGDKTLDMRLTNPFPALAAFMDGFPPMEEMDPSKVDGLPYAVIIYQHLQRWKAAHGGNIPGSYAEKKEFKAQMKAGEAGKKRTLPLNLSEAMDRLNPSIAPSNGLAKVAPLLAKCRAHPINAEASDFWIMVDALSKFVDATGDLPLIGSIPDMDANSEVYMALQQVYRDKAAEDQAVVASTVADTLIALGRAPDAVSDAEIKRFCQNAGKLLVLSTPAYGAPLSEAKMAEFEGALGQLNSEVGWWLLLQAADRFHVQNGHYPGHFDAVEDDIVKLKDCVTAMLEEGKIAATLSDDSIHELCRWGAIQLHSVSSFIGGAGSQEVVKLVTKQYAPLNSVFIYNGITANCTQISL
eukprot:CAMPEP_0182919498 /NCGR_PEP_ID=MMETSP0105_2-20130417/2769_1 /TAXON_ID=81532 ORGANISM="Acanthoeca-like sp., Strain 10tr" /NCGR_SAMPLE_ID=MMETSP0105_2 /ASSEMBLY_ACC=CAM_ASM_000205 /LENGTH=531 /DNA_ID=CAMNT_0025056697 /DNA_START=1 /DNA_END=1596 /DNA_ORIENTATION=+